MGGQRGWLVRVGHHTAAASGPFVEELPSVHARLLSQAEVADIPRPHFLHQPASVSTQGLAELLGEGHATRVGCQHLAEL